MNAISRTVYVFAGCAIAKGVHIVEQFEELDAGVPGSMLKKSLFGATAAATSAGAAGFACYLAKDVAHDSVIETIHSTVASCETQSMDSWMRGAIIGIPAIVGVLTACYSFFSTASTSESSDAIVLASPDSVPADVSPANSRQVARDTSDTTSATVVAAAMAKSSPTPPEKNKKCVIGITGCTRSGKGWVCKGLLQALKDERRNVSPDTVPEEDFWF